MVEKCTVKWKWIGNEPVLNKKFRECNVPPEHQERFRSELDGWIKRGWLEKYQQKVYGELKAVIPLIAVEQPNKPENVRPMMSYRWLDEHVHSNPSVNVVVWEDKLKSWRQENRSSSLWTPQKHICNYILI